MYHGFNRKNTGLMQTGGLSEKGSIPANVSNLEEATHVSVGTHTKPTIIHNGLGSITIGEGEYVLSATNDFTEHNKLYTIEGATFTIPSDQPVYIYASYNDGTPAIMSTTERSSVIGGTIAFIYTVGHIASTDSLSIVDWNEPAKGLPNKAMYRFIETDRFHRVTGMDISEHDTRNVGVTGGIVWQGLSRIDHGEVDTAVDEAYLRINNGDGTWSRDAVTQYPNTQYDDSSGTLQTLADGNYAVVWIYRSMSSALKIHFVLGDGDFTLDEAKASTPPQTASLLQTNTLLIGRIITQKGASTATSIESAFDSSYSASQVVSHSSLTDIQGGETSLRYHSDQPINTDDVVEFEGVKPNTTATTYDDVDGKSIGASDMYWARAYLLALDTLADFRIHDGTNVRMDYGIVSTNLYSADGLNKVTTANSGVSMEVGSDVNVSTDGTETLLKHSTHGIKAFADGVQAHYGAVTRIDVDATDTGLYSQNLLAGVKAKDAELVLYGGTDASVSPSADGIDLGKDTARYGDLYTQGGVKYETEFAVNDGANDRVMANATDTNIAFGTKKVNVNTNGMQYNDGVRDREKIDASETTLSSPNGAVYFRLKDDEARIGYGSNRFLFTATSTQIQSPDGGDVISMTNNTLSAYVAGNNPLNFNSTKTRVEFDTTHYMEITSAGTRLYGGFTGHNVYPATDNALLLGMSDKKWYAVYATNGAIQTSDERLKDFYDLPIELIKILSELQPKSYKWKNQDEKDNDEYHFGFSAQEVDRLFSKYGLDAKEYFLIDNPGEGKSEYYGIAYAEFHALQLMYSQSLEKRLQAIEAKLGL